MNGDRKCHCEKSSLLHDDQSSEALAKEEAIHPFRQAQGPEPVEGLDRHGPLLRASR